MPNEGADRVTKADERGLERLILFSDAVVAIAITLLVLPLTELRPEADEGVWNFLRSEWGEILAFVISFAVIARFWFAHHGMFKHLVRMDRPLLLLNTFWLASVVFLPFPTALLNDRGQYATLYLANLLLTSVLTTALSIHIDRNPALQEEPEKPGAVRHDHVFGAVLIGSIVIALVASLFWQTGAMLLLLLAPIGQRVVDGVVGNWRNRSSRSVAG